MNFLILFLLLITLNETHSSFDSNRKLYVKWIETSKRANYKDVLLSNLLPENSGFSCVWFRANGKMVIDEAGLNYGRVYKYKKTDRECSLVLMKYNQFNKLISMSRL